MKIQINHNRERIGDFLGSVPALQSLAQANDVKVQIHPDLNEMFSFTGLVQGIHDNPDKTYTIDIDGAYAKGWEHNLHMTQSYFEQLDLPTPENPIRPNLTYPTFKTPLFDFVLCPYSVSLSWGHLWTIEKWNELIKSMPNFSFAVLGSKMDKPLKLQKNLTKFYGKTWYEVCNIISNVKCVASVVSGLSHLTYSLGAPHILMVNQPLWAQNPDAKAQLTHTLINEISVDIMRDTLLKVYEGKTLGNIGSGNYIL